MCNACFTQDEQPGQVKQSEDQDQVAVVQIRSLKKTDLDNRHSFRSLGVGGLLEIAEVLETRFN